MKSTINYSKITLLILVAALLWGCGKKTAPSDAGTIRINPHDAKEFVPLSEIADSVKLIKLQTEGDDVIGDHLRIIIKKKYIYVTDIQQKILFVFDREGKFVAKLNKQGQGPGDYLLIGFAFIDEEEEYVSIIDNWGDKILKYSNISFNLIESSPFPLLFIDACKQNGGLYYFATDQIDNQVNGKNTNAQILVVDSANHITTLFDKNIETGKANRSAVYYGVNNEAFTQNDKGELFASIMFDNTFYRLKGREAFPVFTVDFGKYGMNNDIGMKSTQEQMDYIKGTTHKATFPILNVNNSDILSFSYYFKQKVRELGFYGDEDSRLYIELKQSGKTYHVQYIKNDLSSFPERVYLNLGRSYAQEVWFEDYLVEVVNPAQYFGDEIDEEMLVEGLGKVTAMDDPIIVLMKLKKQ